MKFYQDFLSESEFNICYNELLNKLQSDSWKYTKVTWASQEVTEGTTGCVLSSEVSKTVFDIIYNKFSQLIEITENSKISICYYIWQANSGLALHDDGNHKVAGTIYFNENWNPNYGGMFIWKESLDDIIFKGISPTKNMFILNDEQQLHMVTPISPNSPDLRVTIQIWCDERL